MMIVPIVDPSNVIGLMDKSAHNHKAVGYTSHHHNHAGKRYVTAIVLKV